MGREQGKKKPQKGKAKDAVAMAVSTRSRRRHRNTSRPHSAMWAQDRVLSQQLLLSTKSARALNAKHEQEIRLRLKERVEEAQ
jgi:hypothetical protein